MCCWSCILAWMMNKAADCNPKKKKEKLSHQIIRTEMVSTHWPARINENAKFHWMLQTEQVATSSRRLVLTEYASPASRSSGWFLAKCVPVVITTQWLHLSTDSKGHRQCFSALCSLHQRSRLILLLPLHTKAEHHWQLLFTTVQPRLTEDGRSALI